MNPSNFSSTDFLQVKETENIRCKYCTSAWILHAYFRAYFAPVLAYARILQRFVQNPSLCVKDVSCAQFLSSRTSFGAYFTYCHLYFNEYNKLQIYYTKNMYFLSFYVIFYFFEFRFVFGTMHNFVHCSSLVLTVLFVLGSKLQQ